jgi:hypothetical protein
MMDTAAITTTTAMKDMSAMPTDCNLKDCRGVEGAGTILCYKMGIVCSSEACKRIDRLRKRKASV